MAGLLIVAAAFTAGFLIEFVRGQFTPDRAQMYRQPFPA